MKKIPNMILGAVFTIGLMFPQESSHWENVYEVLADKIERTKTGLDSNFECILDLERILIGNEEPFTISTFRLCKYLDLNRFGFIGIKLNDNFKEVFYPYYFNGLNYELFREIDQTTGLRRRYVLDSNFEMGYLIEHLIKNSKSLNEKFPHERIVESEENPSFYVQN